jgi:hypothetical protein
VPVPTAPFAVQDFHRMLVMAMPKSAQYVVTSAGLAVIVSHENDRTSDGCTWRGSATSVSLKSLLSKVSLGDICGFGSLTLAMRSPFSKLHPEIKSEMLNVTRTIFDFFVMLSFELNSFTVSGRIFAV